jgi:two-component system NarL family response regulator
MHSPDAPHFGSEVSVWANAARDQATHSGPRPSQSEALLVIAEPWANTNERPLASLEQSFAVRQITERKSLEQTLLKMKPDVLVVDVALQGIGGARGLPALQHLSPATKIIVLTGAYDEDEGLSALKAGAKGYSVRPMDATQLAKAAGAVLNGEIWAPRRLVRALVAELVSLEEGRKQVSVCLNTDPRLAQLTKRQRLVATLISRGATNKEIGQQLNISERTVKAHLTEAFRNAGVSDRLQLALLLRGRSSTYADD